jgi:AraC family transcriptional regulator
MNPVGASTCRVEAHASFPAGRAFIVERIWDEPLDICGPIEFHRIELVLLPHSHGRVCFPELWSAHRFEPIGDVFFLPGGHMIHTKSQVRRQRTISFDFAPRKLEEWLGHDLRWSEAQVKSALDLSRTEVRPLLMRMGAEILNPGLASEVLIEAMAVQLGVAIMRQCLGAEEAPSSGGLAPWRLRLIDDVLAENPQAPSLADLARVCNLSVRQLSRGFRASRGCTIGDYIAQKRIQHARALLLAGRPVKSVARALGFNSPSNFTVAFRRETGETPRQYRDRERTPPRRNFDA